ncbi:hypothetical protein ACFSUS_00285 [Spirosoma soli]|uniref:Uncharacterized protein n=1 Tax=Spirosoma soli TaxID=1770529 RepID=A0ABW5M0A5_9BACT
MKHLSIGLLCGIISYMLMTTVSYIMIMRFSSNMYDRQVEAATTSAIILGPLGGILAFVAGYLWSKDVSYAR